MKKILSLIFITFITTSLFAQTRVDAKKLSKTLDSNKDASAVFESEISLEGFNVSADGTVTIPFFTKIKSKFVSGMDMTDIHKRLAYSNKPMYTVTFKVKDLATKTYAVSNISDIETMEQYNARLVAEEKKRQEEEKARWIAQRIKNLTEYPVQVINQEVINITGAEASWLPSQIQDKIKSNLQEYLGMKTVVDSKSETALKKLQAESENAGRDENTAIEFGKITTAKFAVFTKIRKTNSGYTISVDFTDLTTGEQFVSATSKEYSKTEYLYSSTGAIDELTLAVANRLEMQISDITKNLLTSGSANFSVDDQLALAKQNEEQFKKMMNQYDSELAKLSVSNDLASVENRKKIEAEKALLIEKQNAERKRQEELTAQKQRAEADAKLEAERSIALKTQRDQMAKDAAAKATEVRKLKMEKQGVLGQINVIESKKKALVEIRQSVEQRSVELFNQLEKDRESEENRIRNKTYTTVELGGDGQPTQQAKERREKQVIKSYEDLTNKFFADAAAVKASTQTQDAALLAEIRADQKALTTTRTVSSMGDEFKVSFGTYEGSKNGWNAYLSLYSDGVLLYTDNFIVNYEALSGKKAPDMATELNDAVIEEYTNNVDMYNSLLTRGDPIIYFEIDYNVTAEADDKPSQYKFNFNKIRVINTVSGKVTQTSALSRVAPRWMRPEWDLREIEGIVEREKVHFRILEIEVDEKLDLNKAKTTTDFLFKNFEIEILKNFVMIPQKKIMMLKTEVTQRLYNSVMNGNGIPYNAYDFRSLDKPIVYVSFYDAIYFCNKLSAYLGRESVYSVNGIFDVNKWNYEPNKRMSIKGNIIQNSEKNGFRLPTKDEWEYAARGGKNYKYSGSDNLDEVAWYGSNSHYKTHPVAQKIPNDYGLYDMSGNVWEMVGKINSGGGVMCRGGCFDHNYYEDSLLLDAPYNRHIKHIDALYGDDAVGFRIVYNY